jgi:cell shape-determining protein MreC
MALKETISKNEEAMNSLNRIMAPLKTIFDWFLDVIMQAVNWILKFVETILAGFAKLAEYLPFVGDKVKELNEQSKKAIELEKEKQELQ